MTARGLKARSIRVSHRVKLCRAFSPLSVVGSFPWALPKAGMKSGRWPSIAEIESNALPSKQRYGFSLITPIFSSLFSFGAMMMLQYGFLSLFRL